MKALSLRQPWANMIASGKKTIETRTWPTTHRGPILIVSCKRPAIEPAGCAVAVAELVDCRPMTRDDEAQACCAVYERAWAWVLERIRPVEPFPVLGRLGLFEIQVDESLLKPLPSPAGLNAVAPAGGAHPACVQDAGKEGPSA